MSAPWLGTRSEGFIEALAAKTSILCELRHATGASDIAKRGQEYLGMRIWSGSLKILDEFRHLDGKKRLAPQLQPDLLGCRQKGFYVFNRRRPIQRANTREQGTFQPDPVHHQVLALPGSVLFESRLEMRQIGAHTLGYIPAKVEPIPTLRVRAAE